MVVALAALAALVVCALAGFSAWSATIGLRLGKFTNRNGIEISRREDPIIFWLSILLGFVPLAACLFIGLWVAYQSMSPSHNIAPNNRWSGRAVNRVSVVARCRAARLDS
jgi:hypothetical protein